MNVLKLIGLLIVLSLVVSVVDACFTIEEKIYYSDKSNFINVSGTVTHIKYSERDGCLYLAFSDLSPKMDDTNFKLIEENAKIAQENGLDDVLDYGIKVDFITAPRYFGDGYVMPIVSLNIDGVCYLEFEEGYDNFIKKW